MQKILNTPTEFVTEMLEGILEAYPTQLRAVEGDNHSLVRTDAPIAGKVGIATGGGSGHLPLFLGYVGKGMLDGVAVGDVFQSPTAEQMLAAVEDLLEHRLRVGHRVADDLQHLGRGGLLLQRFLRLVEQPRVLDRDHRLVGEGLRQRDLPVGERTGVGAHDADGA